MTVPERRKSRNIIASIKRWIDVNFTIPNSLIGSVSLDDRTFDPSGKTEWVEIHFMDPGAGRKSFMLMQAAIYTLVGGKRTSSDQYGDRLLELGDLFHDALHVREIPIYDYSIRASPVIIVDAQVIVVNSDGIYREPESTQVFDPDDGINRMVMTYRFRTLSDYAGGSEYYD